MRRVRMPAGSKEHERACAQEIARMQACETNQTWCVYETLERVFVRSDHVEPPTSAVRIGIAHPDGTYQYVNEEV